MQAIFGGAEVDLYLIATELAKDSRFSVSFVTGDYGQPDTETIEGVRLLKSLDVRKNLFVHGPKIWQALKAANADIYMSEACSLGTFLHALFCRLHHKIFIYRTAHTRETDGSYFRRHKVRGVFVKWAFKQARYLITQNEEGVQSMLFTLGLKAEVIRNGCRITSSPQSKNGSVLWVGRSLPIKRPELFLKLAERFPEQPFVMICPQGVGDRHYERLRQRAAAIDNLRFIEYVPFHEIDTYFQRARIFVCTSNAEGFPNTFVQSCKAAAAILSLRVNPDNFLDKHHCGFCAGGDWELFVKTLGEWLDNDTPEQRGQNGLDYIKTHHDLSVIIEQYKNIFLTSFS